MHLYIIGKTGTGKSTLLENMALQDLERGRGLALIGPYRVGFTIAHQYIHQVEPDIRSPVFGNVGSVISFRVGAEDRRTWCANCATISHADFLQLPDHRIYLKLSHRRDAIAPFSAVTLAPEARVQGYQVQSPWLIKLESGRAYRLEGWLP